MVAASIYSNYQKGDIVNTSRGISMVCDYGDFPVTQFDIATVW